MCGHGDCGAADLLIALVYAVSDLESRDETRRTLAWQALVEAQTVVTVLLARRAGSRHAGPVRIPAQRPSREDVLRAVNSNTRP